MATGTYYATSSVSGTCLTPANAVGSTAGTWTTNVDGSSWDHTWEMDVLPFANVTSGAQTLTLRVRKDTGTSPTMAVYLLENGTQTQTLVTGRSVASTTGEDVILSFTPNDTSARYRIRVVATFGGSGSTRATVQLDYIKWDATYVTKPVDMELFLTNTAQSFYVPYTGQAYTVADNITAAMTAVVVTCAVNSGSELTWVTKGIPADYFPSGGALRTQAWLPTATGGGTGWTLWWKLRRINSAGVVQAQVDQPTSFSNASNNNTIVGYDWTGLATSLGTFAAGDALVVSMRVSRDGTAGNNTLSVNVNTETYSWASGLHQGTGFLLYGGTDTPMTVQSNLTADATVVVPAVTHQGAADLTAQSNATAAGVRVQDAAAAMTAQSDSTSASTVVKVGAAALTAQSALTAAGVSIDLGVAALTAQSGLTAAGTKVQFAASALTAQSSLTADTGAVMGAATLTAQSAAAAAATVVKVGASALTAQSSATAAGVRVQLGATALTAQSASTSASTVIKPGASSLTVQSSLAAAGLRIAVGASALSAQSSLSATGDFAGLNGSASLSAQSAATAAAIVVVVASAPLTSTATFTAAATVSTTVSGSATLTVQSGATASALPVRLGAVALSGTTTLSGTGKGLYQGTAALAADLTVTGAARLAAQASATWVARSSLSATGKDPDYFLILPTVRRAFTTNELWRRKPIKAGQTLLLKDGVGRYEESPTDVELKASDAYYQGGYMHPLTNAERAALIAAGYGDLIVLEE